MVLVFEPCATKGACDMTPKQAGNDIRIYVDITAASFIIRAKSEFTKS